jgi:hypothetical protein
LGCTKGRSAARVGVIDRSVERSPCARRCRRTEALSEGWRDTLRGVSLRTAFNPSRS